MALERRTYTGPLRQSGAVRGVQRQAATSRQVAAVRIEALGASPGGAAAGADLGGSSKYSNENFED
jgi:hypothetical protein